MEYFCTRARRIGNVNDDKCKKPTNAPDACSVCHVWQNVQTGGENLINIDGSDVKVIQYGPILNKQSVLVLQY